MLMEVSQHPGNSERPHQNRPGGFLEDIPFGVWICNTEGGLEYASSAFLNLVGMSMEEASGFGWTKQLLVEEGGDSLERWRQCVRRECDWDDEHRIRGRDGKVRTLLARGHAVRNTEGMITRWVGVHLDITQRRRQEERLQMLKAVQGRQEERERIAQRLHDHLQQLLLGARMQLASASRPSTDDLRTEKLAKVNDILTQAISASRNLSAELNPPALYESGLVQALEWLADFMGGTHNLHVETELCVPQEPQEREVRIVVFDAVRELLLNVVKHAGVQRAKVIASRTNGELCVTVTDHGMGFDPEQTQQSDPAAGLGLTGIRRRIEALGGSCKVGSQPGKGSAVEICVPIAEP